jgi:HK97 family phage major capsid protein
LNSPLSEYVNSDRRIFLFTLNQDISRLLDKETLTEEESNQLKIAQRKFDTHAPEVLGDDISYRDCDRGEVDEAVEIFTRSVIGWDEKDRSGGTTHGGFSMEWLAEKATGTRQKAKLLKIMLAAKKGAIYCQMSNELAADGMGIEEQLRSALVSSIGFGLDGKFFFGSGAGVPAGALSSANPALITVAKESGQTAATIEYKNLAKMFARVAPRCLKNAVWHANMTTIPQLLELSIPVGTGGSHVPVLKESNGKFYIFGVEVVFTEQMKSLGTLGDISLVDWTQYAVGLRKEVAIDKSNAPGWTEDMTDYRVIVRVDGQGTWNKAITPKNGDTLSWAVTLAERS